MGSPRVCVRCHQESGGLLFCSNCAPTDTIRQDATVYPPPINATTGGTGATPSPEGRTDVRAKERPDPERKPAREVTSVDRWNEDRHRLERCTIYKDRPDNLMIEVWQDIETGDITFVKEHALDDQEAHGARTRRAQQQGLDGVTPPEAD